jgi:hypothetical protein
MKRVLICIFQYDVFMLDLKKLQQEILANKIAKGFNTTDIFFEF